MFLFFVNRHRWLKAIAPWFIVASLYGCASSDLPDGTNKPAPNGSSTSNDSSTSTTSNASTTPSASAASPVREFTNSIGMRFAGIDRASFRMGSDPGEKIENDEQPAHDVSFSYSFFMGRYEVRAKDYLSVMGSIPESKNSTASNSHSEPEFPVRNVSWKMANEFCRRLSENPQERIAGRVYRLPTEAEWECCCRAGTDTRYSTGDSLPNTKARFREENTPSSQYGPTAVASYQANAFGLYDMHGNVWEWCLDWYGERYYRESPTYDPTGPEQGSRRVIRGGGWNSTADFCRAAFRDGKDPDAQETYLGFRIVCLTGNYVNFDIAGHAGNQDIVRTKNETTRKNGDQDARPADIGSTDIASIIENVEPAIVRIDVHGSASDTIGSGFLVFDNQTVVTNYHVIERGNTASVEFADGTRISARSAVAMLPQKDLAFLHLESPYAAAKPLALADKLPKKGERAVAFGSPLGLSFTASEGIVSAVRDSADMQRLGISFGPKVTWIQTTTPISSGSSGGPLIDRHGKVIGVTTLVVPGRGNGGEAAQNLNFAVSVTDFPVRESLSHPGVPLDSRRDRVLNSLQRMQEWLESSQLGGDSK